MSGTALRAIRVLGPGEGKAPLWEARLDLAVNHDVDPAGNHQGFAAASFVRNHALRTLQEARGTREFPVPGAGPADFHDPLLLAAAVRCEKLSLTDSGLADVVPDPDANTFAQVLLAPVNDAWPVKEDVIIAPDFRLVEGRIDVLADAGSAIAKMMGIQSAAAEYLPAFGGEILLDHPAGKNGRRLKLSLVPDGVEFDAKVPDPFTHDGQSCARLRLCIDQSGRCLLRVVSTEPSQSWRETLGRLGDASRTSKSPVRFDLWTEALPFHWPVTKGNPLNVDRPGTVACLPGTIRASLRGAPLPGSALPSICDLTSPRCEVSRPVSQGRPVQVHIQAGAKGEWAKRAFSRVAIAFHPTGDDQPRVSLGEANGPARLSRQAFTVDVQALRRDTESRRAAMGVSTDPAQPTPVFLALERGVVQVPLPPHDDGAKPAAAWEEERSFSGVLRLALKEGPDGPSGAGILVDDAAHVAAVLAFTDAKVQAALVHLDRVTAIVDGILWLADALPTADEVIPTLAAGPIAVRALPVRIHPSEPVPGAPLSGHFSPIEDGLRPARVEMLVQGALADVVHWAPPMRLPLVPLMGMTRTSGAATLPSQSRDLVPVVHAPTDPKKIWFALGFDAAGALPKAVFRGGVHPWAEQFRMPLVPLTLPDLEVGLPLAASAAPGARLAYDLPLLSELFANAAPPPAEGEDTAAVPTEGHGATTLNMPALQRFWAGQVRKLALSRTEDDRLFQTYLAKEHVHTKTVDNLVRPGSWTPTFAWREDDPDKRPFGQWSLGKEPIFGEAALAGLSFEALKLDGIDDLLRITGFAAARQAVTPAGAPAQLFDSRGFGMTQEAPAAVGDLVVRTASLRTAAGRAQYVRLTTTQTEVKLALPGGATARLWLRDFPVDASGEFTADGSPEGATGPDDRALNWMRASDVAYEWRLHDGNCAWDIPMGAFRIRPLRIFRLRVEGDRIVSLTVIVDVALRAATPPKNVPFGPEDLRGSDNPVAMEFIRDNGQLTLDALKEVTVDQGAITVGSTPPHVGFTMLCDVDHGDAQGNEARVPARLDGTLESVGGALQLTDARLKCRLFGWEKTLTAPPSDGSYFFFGGDGLDTVILKVNTDGTCRLGFVGRIAVPADGVTRLAIDLGESTSTVQWLGARAELDTAKLRIDHDAGTLWADFNVSKTTAPIRGFPEVGQLHGTVAIALATDEVPLAVSAMQAVVTWSGDGFLCKYCAVVSRGTSSEDCRVSLPSAWAKSAIGWPLASVANVAELVANTFVADENDAAAFRVEVDVLPDPSPARHQLRPALQDIALPLSLLGVKDGVPYIATPWTFMMAVEHRLLFDNARALQWTSIDQVQLFDLEAVADAKRDTYGFMPRYRSSKKGGSLDADPAEVPAPGVVRVGAMPRQLTDALAAPGAAKGLAMLGGGLLGWIWGDGKALHAPLPWLVGVNGTETISISQSPGRALTIVVAKADLAAAIPQVAEAGRVIEVSVANGGAAATRRTLAQALQAAKGGRAVLPWRPEEWRIVDRAFAGAEEDTTKDASDPTHRLHRPLFWRALLVLVRLSRLAAAEFENLRPASILPGAQAGESMWIRPRLTGAPDPAVTRDVIVIERKTVRRMLIQVPPGAEEQRQRALAQIVMARCAEPLLAGIATYDDDPDDAAALSGITPLPLPLAVLPPLAVARPRDRARSLHASDRLGWPSDLPQLPPISVGADFPVQDREVAWTARAATFGTARAASAADTETTFLALGRRVLFQRSDNGVVSAPFRALQPAPARVRAPLAAEIANALGKKGVAVEKAPPLLPGPIEVVTTGGRAGVMGLRHAGLIEAAAQAEPFDAAHPRFGRPGNRGPMVWGADRTPRSAGLPQEARIDRRRRTWVDANIHDEGELAEVLLLKGSGTIVPFQPSALLSPHPLSSAALVIDVQDPPGGLLPADWRGVVTLKIRLSGVEGLTAKSVLQRMGWLAATDPPEAALRASLSWGDFAAPFRRAQFVADRHGTVALTLLLGQDGMEDLVATRTLIETARPESQVSLLLRWPRAFAQAVAPSDEFALSTGPEGGLEPGPPRTLNLPLTIRPARGPFLPLPRWTVVFGDPAYDRALSGAAAMDRAAEGKDTFLLSLDRTEYGPSDTVTFACGIMNPDFEMPERPAEASPFRPPSGGSFLLGLTLLPRGAPGDSLAENIPLRIRGVVVVAGAVQPVHPIEPGAAYSVPVSQIEAADGQPLDLQPGDRIRWTVWPPPSSPLPRPLSVMVGVVARTAVSPPEATYALVTHSGDTATAALFATAPLPQRIEFPDARQLLIDLARGYVRRRAIFEWTFVPRGAATAVQECLIVKLDRTGGGQIGKP